MDNNINNNIDQKNSGKSRWLRRLPLIASIIIGLIIAIGVISYFYYNQTGASFSNADLYMNPSSILKDNKQPFTIVLSIAPRGNKMTGVELYINYDPTKLRLVSIDQGKYGYLPILLEKKTDVSGTAIIALGTSPNNQKRLSHIMASLVFEPLQNGVSDISYGVETKVVSSEKNNENIVGKKGSTRIDIH